MIVVFDSSVWISALRFSGIPLAAVRKAFASDTITCCHQIEDEVERVLVMKFGWETRSAAQTMQGYLAGGLDVAITGTLRTVCRDPNDDMVLECALIANADVIVSGDQDLLVLQSWSAIPILTPRDYLAL